MTGPNSPHPFFFTQRAGQILHTNTQSYIPPKKKKSWEIRIFFWGVFLLELRCSHSSEQSDPSQPERDSIGQTPKEKGSMQHGERKKVAYRAPAAQVYNHPSL